MSAYVEFSDKQVLAIIREHIDNMRSTEDAETFLLFVIKQVGMFHGFDWSEVKRIVDKRYKRQGDK